MRRLNCGNSFAEILGMFTAAIFAHRRAERYVQQRGLQPAGFGPCDD
jgi:hypothetical protein